MPAWHNRPPPQRPRKRALESQQQRRRDRKLPESLMHITGIVAIIAAQNIEARYEEMLGTIGLRVCDFIALSVIGQRPGLSYRVVGERLGVGSSRASDIINLL